jgi:hypothetical protein
LKEESVMATHRETAIEHCYQHLDRLFEQLFVQKVSVQPDIEKECTKCQVQATQLENGDGATEADSDKESVTDSQFSNETQDTTSTVDADPQLPANYFDLPRFPGILRGFTHDIIREALTAAVHGEWTYSQFDKAINYIMDGFFRETLSQTYLDNIKRITLCECPEELAEDKSQNCIRCNAYVCKVSTFNPYSAGRVYRNGCCC